MKSRKFQAPKIKTQTNPNDPKSKFQTNVPIVVVLNDIITGWPGFKKHCYAVAENFLDIEY
jgi:hypothetical protein